MAGDERKKDKNEYAVDHLVQSAYGYSDELLLERIERAESEISDEEIPPGSDKDLKGLLVEIERRNLKPHFEGDAGKGLFAMVEGDKETTERKTIRLGGHFVRMMIAAAILCSVLVATGITVGAKIGYEYRIKSRVEIKSDTVLNNTEVKEQDDALDLAYVEIYETTGINVLRLGERPKKLRFEKVFLNTQRAVMYFKYGEQPFSIVQQIRTEDNSVSIVSDRTEVCKVYNEWLKKEIVVEKSVISKGKVEYSANIVENNVYYYLAGIMKEQEFINIVEGVHLSE